MYFQSPETRETTEPRIFISRSVLPQVRCRDINSERRALKNFKFIVDFKRNKYYSNWLLSLLFRSNSVLVLLGIRTNGSDNLIANLKYSIITSLEPASA